MNTEIPGLDSLNPEHRAKFEAKPMRRWQITWRRRSWWQPEDSEIVEAHSMSYDTDTRTATFNRDYLGVVRVVQARDIREI